jgi:hypothetical protein
MTSWISALPSGQGAAGALKGFGGDTSSCAIAAVVRLEQSKIALHPRRNAGHFANDFIGESGATNLKVRATQPGTPVLRE